MFYDSVNTFSTTFPEYENRAALFAKPAARVPVQGTFLREREFQRNPFALPGFSFETREPPPLGLPSDRLASILKERKKTPAEIREIVQTVVNGPQPDTSSPFQYFLWSLGMEMKKPANNYPDDVILKLISDLVIAQPQILEKIPTAPQIRNREVYLENIPPFLLDVQGNLTTKLPALDEYKLQFEGKELKEALVESTYGDKPAVDSKGNKIRASTLNEDEGLDVFTFDPAGGKSLPPSFSFIYMNYHVIDYSFLSLVNFDILPENEAVLLEVFTYVFVPSSRNAPEEITKPPFRAILLANDTFLGNFILGLDEDDEWISLYLTTERPLKERTRFCKAFFLEAIQFFINQSSKPQFVEIYRHFYTTISALNFELPYAELIARLRAVYSALYNELRMPKLENVPQKEEKHGAFAPSRRGSIAGAPVGAPAAPVAPSRRGSRAPLEELGAIEAYKYVEGGKEDYEKNKSDKKEQDKVLRDLAKDLKNNYTASELQRDWTVTSITRQLHFDLLSEPENVLSYLLVASGVRDENKVEHATRTELELILQQIQYGNRNQEEWMKVFNFLKDYESLDDLKAAEGASKMNLTSSSSSSGTFSSAVRNTGGMPNMLTPRRLTTSQLVSGVPFTGSAPVDQKHSSIPAVAPTIHNSTIMKTIHIMAKNILDGKDVYVGIANVQFSKVGYKDDVYTKFLGYELKDEGYHDNKWQVQKAMQEIQRDLIAYYGKHKGTKVPEIMEKIEYFFRTMSPFTMLSTSGRNEKPGFPLVTFIDPLLELLREFVESYVRENKDDPHAMMRLLQGSGLKRKGGAGVCGGRKKTRRGE